ncbi:response regulator transcription factor [Sediminimonas sp.]|jgi:DNA-binding NarL/FixJ family response regulator|uniref:response regulator n=1 Tax=Sediminimonas sp. TaxID=2823379 RepID=UPI0025F183D7|nr:response regulator transcription factor [Sediminimonas sp.]
MQEIMEPGQVPTAQTQHDPDPTEAPKVLIADDHGLVRETLAAYLSDAGGIAVTQAGGLEEALAVIGQDGPFDLVLLDFTMPGMSLPDGMDRVRALNPDGAVALISGTAPDGVGRRAMECGAAGFLPKTMAPMALLAAVAEILGGGTYAPAAILHADPLPPHDRLTPREREVLEGLCAARSNKEIARDLDVQEVTVKLHVKTLSRKLGARNRTHAAMIARDLWLV